VLKLQKLNFTYSERWWVRVVEDAQRIRREYLQYSDDEIINRGSDIHLKVATSVKDYLIKLFGLN
jgi:hypothetical protein